MIRKRAIVLSSLLISSVVMQPTLGADYHFSAVGNDATGNGSLANPWRTITKLNGLNLDPGDQVLFRAGDTFTGNILLDANDSATSATGVYGGIPIRFDAYGVGGRPIISSPSGNGFRATNAGGLEIHGLQFAGLSAPASIANVSNSTRGLYFENSLSTFRQQHILVDDVVITGFGEAGIDLHATNPTINSGGFADVRIANSDINLNGRSGIVSSISSSSGTVVGGSAFDFYARAHSSFVLTDNIVRNTTGKSGDGGVSGNGIVLAQIDGATIERNMAHHNGGVGGGGGVGIWVWEADHAIIQFNEAYANQTFDGRDGGGFDLDGGARNSVMQYNYSHGNEGAGLGLFQFSYASDMGGNAIRYNLSEGDGAGISVWGNGPRYPGTDAAEDSIYHNNTIINPNGPAAHFFGTVDDVGLYNNILVTNGQPLIWLDDWDGAGSDYTLDVDFRGNAYSSSGAPFLIKSGVTNYNSLTAWANATGQEKIGGSIVGLEGDPQLTGPFNGGVKLDDPALLETLAAYRLLASSPLVNAGVDFSSLPLPIALGLTDPGTRDFFGSNIPLGGSFDIGAHEQRNLGDFNADGTVDALDYTLWRNHLGDADESALDFNGDGGAVTEADFALWKQLYGHAYAPAGSGGGAVPEPSTVVLWMAALAIARCRHSRS